ncbi:MAG: efflux RND transporter periplasmic adaptor subunit [Candidatus Symbiothrix sp.]|jgi:membrane fusion protein (multidrug efflux system)|nr:efflux RND transporter periplasmic adaptor subunit [Candidatus Symbiothrix sp.]
MKRTTRIILFAIIAVLLLGMAFFTPVKHFFTKNDSLSAPASGKILDRQKSQPLNVYAKILHPETLSNIIYVSTATLIPDEEVDLSFESTGKITDIFFKEGSNVQKGQLLAKVNDQPLQAELQKLQAQIPLAEDRVFRQKSLLEKDAVSREAYEQVSTELEKLKADIELVQARIAQTELRAPFDGVIGLRNVSVGAYVSSSTVISHLTKISPLKIEFSVPERQADFIHAGMPITFRINAESDINIYNATIYAVESRLDEKMYTLKVRAVYPNSNHQLHPGSYASVEIVSHEIPNALVVPNEAVIAEMGHDIAYVYSDGHAKRVELTKGMRTEANLHIVKGLEFGDTLIISGIMQLRDDLPVTLDKLN